MFAQMVDVSAEVRAAEFLRAANNLNELALTMATQDEISAALLFHLRQLLAADVGLLVGLEQGLWTIWQVSSEEGRSSDATAVLDIDVPLSDPVLVEALAAGQVAVGRLSRRRDGGSGAERSGDLAGGSARPRLPDLRVGGAAAPFRAGALSTQPTVPWLSRLPPRGRSPPVIAPRGSCRRRRRYFATATASPVTCTTSPSNDSSRWGWTLRRNWPTAVTRSWGTAARRGGGDQQHHQGTAWFDRRSADVARAIDASGLRMILAGRLRVPNTRSGGHQR